MYLKSEVTLDKPAFENSIYPAFPAPPKYLVEKDCPIEHIPAENLRVDPLNINQIISERRAAETGFANLYSEKLSIEEFNQKLLRKLNAFNRYRQRVRKLVENLKGIDGSIEVTSKMLQKDLFIAERTIENIQIENQSFLEIIQNHEQKEAELSNRLADSESNLEQLKFQFQSLAESFDEKNKMLELAEARYQTQLLNMEKVTAEATQVGKKTSVLQDEISYLKSEVSSSQLREINLTQLNSELAQTLVKLQSRVKELELNALAQKKEFEFKIQARDHEEKNIQEEADTKALIERTASFAPALQDLTIIAPSEKVTSGEAWACSELNSRFLSEVYPSITVTTAQPKAKENLKGFYERWSHVLNEMSSLSTPIHEFVSFSQLEKQETKSTTHEQLISEQGELGI